MEKVIRFLDSTGDTRVAFKEDDPVAMAKAKEAYDAAVKKGSIPFAVNRAGGAEDKKLTSFDQVENDTIMVPRIVGG